MRGSRGRVETGRPTEPGSATPRLSEDFKATGPLRALIISQPTDYGVAVCVRQQARAAREAGHHVAVAAPSSGPLRAWLSEDDVPHVPLGLKRQPGIGDLRAVLAIRRLVRGGQYDVVSLHSSKAGAVGRLGLMTIRKRRRPKVIFTPHSWSWNVGGRLAPLYVALEKWLASVADAIVAVSAQEANEGRAVLRQRADRIQVIPNGVDLTRFSPDGPVASRRTDVELIVCVGRLSPQKGQDIAIRAMGMMANKRARLRLVGAESHSGQLERLQLLAESLGVAERIEWMGRVDDPAAHFRAADVVVAPSRWEGMSLVFLEATACGAPVIVSDVAGSQALSSTGIVIPPDDPGSLARALDDLLSDGDKRLELASRAIQRRREFDLTNTLARNLDLWHDGSSETWSMRARAGH